MLIPAGMDFTFLYAQLNYKFLDRAFSLIGSRREGMNLKLRYSTVDEYVTAIKQE